MELRISNQELWPQKSLPEFEWHIRGDLITEGVLLVRGDVDTAKIFTVEFGGASVHVEG